MELEGSSCGIVTHPLTDDDLHECQRILLSDEFDWDPSNNFFENSSIEEEYRTSSSFHRYINFFKAESHEYLQKSSVYMTQEFMSLIEQWKCFHWNGSGLDGGNINKQGQI